MSIRENEYGSLPDKYSKYIMLQEICQVFYPQQNMNFNQAYNYILSLNNLPRKEYMSDPRHCGWYLLRLQFFLNLIGNPERKIPHYIHVTGTSGKGSVTAYLHSILQASGKTVGSTYSPHPTIITERWKVGKHYMTKKEFADIVEYLKPKLDEYIAKTPYDMLSFFEVTEAIGLLFFVRKKVSWAVMEVACGGRTDSSNIIPWKDAAIITNIGVDHIGVLGRNKAEIAYEKAGIIKRGAPVFTMEKDEKMLEIIRKECKKNSAKLYLSHPTPYALRPTTDIGHMAYDVGKMKFSYQNENYSIPCLGAHQIRNAILCIEIAQHLGISRQSIKKGLSRVQQPLRMEVVSKNPLIILDGAHNPDKMRTTVDTLHHYITTSPHHSDTRRNVNLLVGFSGDKNVAKMIKQLVSLKPKTIAVTRNTTNPFRKVADPQSTSKQFKKLLPKTKIKIFLDPKTALAWSKKQTKKDEILLVTGSIFVSGELRPQFKVKKK